MTINVARFAALLVLGGVMPAAAQSGLDEVIAIADKYVKLCQTDDLNDVLPSLIADGLNKPPRGPIPVKVIGDWEFSVAPYNTRSFAALQEQQGGIAHPFACNITASFSTDIEPDISYLQSHFAPILKRQFGAPTYSTPHKAQWCETIDGGMSISASSRPVGAGRGGRSSSSEVVNAFTIGMGIGSQKGFCRPQ